MLKLIAKRKYRTEVLSAMMAALAQLEGNHKLYLRHYPGMEKAINSGFETERNANELGITLACIVLTDNIEKQNDVEWRNRILLQLRERIAAPGWSFQLVQQQTKAHTYPKSLDDFVWRLEWFLSWCARAHADGQIDLEMRNYYSSEVVGALRGLTSDERKVERFNDFFCEAGSGDGSE